MERIKLVRYLLAGVCVVATLCTMVACSNNSEESSSSEDVIELTMQDVYESAFHENYLSVYDSYEITTVYYDGSEEVIYGDDEIRSVTSSSSCVLHSLSSGYIMGESDGTYFVVVGDVENEGLQIVCENIFISENTLNESIDEYVISGDTHIIRTFFSGDDAKEELEWWGLEYEEGDIVQLEYRIDTTMNLLYQYSEILIREDEEEFIMLETNVVYDQEPNEESLEILDVISTAEEEREITLTVDPNTDDETVYQLSVPAGYVMSFYLPETCSTLYEDEACTIPVESAFDTYIDVHVYSVTD